MEALTFRHALQDDVEQIIELVGAAIEKMKASGIRLYENESYIRKGSVFWRKGEFFLMERKLEGNF